jgi:hypothetical protein
MQSNGASKPWPPPPDLYSIQELVARADVEHYIADGAPQDEYEMEANQLFAVLKDWPTADLIAERLMPVLIEIWETDFSIAEAGLAKRRKALEGLAAEIERFFGPGAQPQVRSAAGAATPDIVERS